MVILTTKDFGEFFPTLEWELGKLLKEKKVNAIWGVRAVRLCWFEKDISEMKYIEIDLHEESIDR